MGPRMNKANKVTTTHAMKPIELKTSWVHHMALNKRQAITLVAWINIDIVTIEYLGTKYAKILIEIETFPLKPVEKHISKMCGPFVQPSLSWWSINVFT